MAEPSFGKFRISHNGLSDMPSSSNSDHDGRYLKLSGGVMTGNLTMSNAHILLSTGCRIITSTKAGGIVTGQIFYDRGDKSFNFFTGGASSLSAVLKPYQLQIWQLLCAIPTGTKPLDITSTTLCSSLNADLHDGYHAGNSSGQIPISNATLCTGLNADGVDGYHAGNSSGQVAVSNGTVCTNLVAASAVNADTVDTYHAGNSSGQVAVSNGTVCTNLNADLHDGYHAGNSSGQVAVSNGSVCTNLNADLHDGYHAGNSSGQVAVSNGTVCTDLYADLIDNRHLVVSYVAGANVNTGSSRSLVYSGSGASTSYLRVANVFIANESIDTAGITQYWQATDTTSWTLTLRNDSGGTRSLGVMGFRFSTTI